MTEVVLALVASVFTASASVLQRLAAAPAPGELRFSWRLVAFLLHRPMWFLGIVCMILGFVFQLVALRFGDLSLVEPIVASELLFVFAFLAVRRRGEVRSWDWVAAAGMAGSLGGFLFLANPQGGSPAEAGAWTWLLGGAACGMAATVLAGLSVVRVRHGDAPSRGRKAALLGASAGIGWGFVAAVIKELSFHVGGGFYAVFTNWSPYVILLAGAAALFLATNAFQAGPLAASQPGLTIFDPLVASLLGITLFGEHVQHGWSHVAGEGFLGIVLCASVVILSHSPLVGSEQPASRRHRGRGPLKGVAVGGPGGELAAAGYRPVVAAGRDPTTGAQVEGSSRRAPATSRRWSP